MNQEYNKKVTGVKPTTVAMFEGVFSALVGIVIAILFAISQTVEATESTHSVLAGLTFGVASGAVAILVVPLVYFGLGWLIGLVHGFIFNVVLGSSGGIAVRIEKNDE